MAFDFKKEYKALYKPKEQPEIIEVPTMNYIAIRGKGDPNEAEGDYQKAIGVIYAVAYTLRMSYKTSYKIEGFFEYVVPPLEGFWWQESIKGMDYSQKDKLHWISLIRLPDFITKEHLEWAIQEVYRKKKLDCSHVEYLTLEEGLCVQMLHRGAFDDEPQTVAMMDQYLEEQGYVNDFSKERLHHEIYLSDPRRVEVSRWQTVIRHPVKKK
ncbi:MAG: GyrI-like domain-containing protein [Cellulosilyticaceae bacterium]